MSLQWRSGRSWHGVVAGPGFVGPTLRSAAGSLGIFRGHLIQLRARAADISSASSFPHRAAGFTLASPVLAVGWHRGFRLISGFFTEGGGLWLVPPSPVGLPPE